MIASTPETRQGGVRRFGADFIELLTSMRFAVSLLSFICLASIMGTVLVQNQPSNNYVNQFGQFWYAVFDQFSLYHVYNAWWFLLIMTFLVTSTSLCLIRTSPKMIKDIRTYRENVRENSLRSFHHKGEFDAAGSAADVTLTLSTLLKKRGFSIRAKQNGEATLLAAKKGSGNRIGYIFAHSAIVIICIGGLLDSELPVRLQIWFGHKQPLYDNMAIADVPASGRLGVGNPSFRSNVLIPEGGQSRNAIVMIDDGAMVQPLPFTLELKKFIIDYYSTGMPRLFASEVEVTDPDTGKKFPATIRVNEPLRYKGVTVYQSSFDDGGSTVNLTGYSLRGTQVDTFPVNGVIGSTAALAADKASSPELKNLTVEFTAFRPINVENFADRNRGAAAPKPFSQQVASVAGSAAHLGQDKDFHNVGPSVQYKLRDASGQAYEFHNYMLPVDFGGMPVFLAGMRANPDDEFRYMRIPADAQSSVKEFMALRATLQDPAARALAAHRFAVANRQGMADSPSAGELVTQLDASAHRALDTFAQGGLQSIAKFLESNVAANEQQRAADVVIKLLGGAMAELRGIERERSGLPPLSRSGPDAERDANWLQLSITALSDMYMYPAPVMLSLSNFKHVQASVFQVSRAPGKNAVYVGCLLLISGIFSMFFIRERRVWIWVKPSQGGAPGAHAMMAMTSQRRTLDFNREFERLKAEIAGLLQTPKGDV
jgi:cytochrome c biogenesis protein